MFFVVLLITSVFVACNNDTTKPANELAGEWNLVSISCECPPVTLNSGESIMRSLWTKRIVRCRIYGTSCVITSLKMTEIRLLSGVWKNLTVPDLH